MKYFTIAGVAFLACTVASCQKISQPVPKPSSADNRPVVADAGKNDSDPVIEIRNQQELTLKCSETLQAPTRVRFMITPHSSDVFARTVFE